MSHSVSGFPALQFSPMILFAGAAHGFCLAGCAARPVAPIGVRAPISRRSGTDRVRDFMGIVGVKARTRLGTWCAHSLLVAGFAIASVSKLRGLCARIAA